MRLKTGPHDGIRGIHVPLTKRILEAHVADLLEWGHECAPDSKERKEYEARIERLEGLFRRLEKKNASAAT